MTTITPAVLRPTQAAAYIGSSVPTFWRRVKDDPDFPRPFKVGPNSTVVMRASLDAWLKAKQEAA